MEKTMSKAKLDQEEKELLKAYEAGEYESVLTPTRKNQIREAASRTFKKDKRSVAANKALKTDAGKPRR